MGAEPPTGLPVMGASGGGKPKNHPSPLTQSPLRPGDEGAGRPPGRAQWELVLNCPGRKPGVLVWTGAVLN